MKYPNIQLGTVEAVWNKLGGEEGVARFLRGEIRIAEPTKSWREQDGVIYFSVTSDGTTGEEWITRLEGKKYNVWDYAKSILRNPDFKPTKGVTTEVAVLKGILFSDDNRLTRNIRAEAEKRKFEKPNAEIACLIREKFTDKELEEMGLWWIVAMSDTINDSDGDPSLLSDGRDYDGRYLYAYCVRPGYRWDRDYGFAFAVSQVSA